MLKFQNEKPLFRKKEIMSGNTKKMHKNTAENIYIPPECRLSLSSSVTLTRIESSPMDFISSTVMYRYCCWSLSIGSSPIIDNIIINDIERDVMYQKK